MVATNDPRGERALPPGEEELQLPRPLLNGTSEPQINPDAPEAFGSGRGLAAEYEAFGRLAPETQKEKKNDNQKKVDRPAEKEKGKTSEEKEEKNEEKKGEEEGNDKKDQDDKPKKPTLYKRPLAMTILIAVVLLLGIAALIWWLYARQYVSTDDAYIDGHVVQVAPQVAAPVKALHVDDNIFVHKGDLMVELDPTDYQVALQQAQGAESAARGKLTQAQAQVGAAHAGVTQSDAEIAAAQARLENAQADLKRYESVDPRARSQQQLDNARTAEKDAEAQLEQAKAKRASAQANVGTAEASVKAAQGDLDKALADEHRAQVNLGYCKLYAPQDGRVTSRTVEVGNYVTAGQAIFSLVSPDVWVTANFKETQLKNMRLGQPVTLTVDAYPGKKWNGHVDSIQAGSGSRFSVLPAENATGNFVKIVQRVPVKIVFDYGKNTNDSHLLSPGMSVEPKVKVR
ncbi:MAG: HlyD family secretion protein [Phycisphaerae bacterium]